MEADLTIILDEEYRVHTTLDKLQPGLQLELRRLQKPPTTMTELRSEASRLESILGQQRPNRSTQGRQNRDSNSRKQANPSTQNKGILEQTNDTGEKGSLEKKTKTGRPYLATEEYQQRQNNKLCMNCGKGRYLA